MNTTQLLPWGWTITAEDATLVTCPSASRVLGTFALVNVAVTTLGVIFGNRYVLNRLTCGRFFNNKDSKTHRFMWIINVALQLGANALIGAIVQRTPGYKADFKIWELMLFFTVRPRLSWIALMLLSLYEKRSSVQEKRYSTPAVQETIVQNPKVVADEAKTTEEEQSEVPLKDQADRPWASAAKSQAFAEIALQIIALYVMFKTVHFAVPRRYYLVWSKENKSLPAEAKLMYAGALFYAVLGSSILLFEILAIYAHYTESEEPARNPINERRSGTVGRLETHQNIATYFILYNLCYTWLGSWLFWAGFVRLAGNL